MTDFAFAVPLPVPRSPPWGTVASLTLHGTLALALLLLPQIRAPGPPEPSPVNVEIVTPEEFAALQPAEPAPLPSAIPAPSELPTPAPSEQPVPAVPNDRLPSEPAPHPPRTVTATEFYAERILRQPDMQRIRRSLTGFADSERIVQLCNIEALEQIRRAAPGSVPDTLVAYAMSDPLWNGLTLSAAGGAFRSKRKWYAVAFHCTVASGYEAVTAFDFTLGDAIPEDQWEEHYLNAEDANDD